MKKIKILFLLLLSFGLFGCTGKKNINDLTFLSSVGIDKTEDGFIMVAQIVNRNVLVPNAPQITPVYVITSSGQTVFECFRNMDDKIPSRPYMINLQLLVFGEEIAKEGIKDYIHYFINYSEAQHEFNVLLVKGVTVEEFLSQISVFSMFPTRVLINKLKTSVENYGFAKETYVEEVVNSLRSESENLVMSSVTVTGDLKKGGNIDHNKETKVASIIAISDMGVFDGDKLIGWLNKEEGMAWNFVKEEIKSSVLVVNGKTNNKISVLISKGKSKVKVQIKDGKPKVNIDVSFVGTVVEDTALVIELDKEYEKDVIKKLEELVKKQLMDCIEKSQKELKLDIFSFSTDFYRKETEWWKQNKDNYKEIYENMEIEVNVKTNILRLDI